MALLIDPPLWPARGTVFSHLVSDASLEELHEFAERLGAHPRAFDEDHYDVPQRFHARAVSLGAVSVSGADLVRRLIASGLRRPAALRRREYLARTSELRSRWAEVLPEAPTMGEELLERWGERGRRYHDPRHLLEVLKSLDALSPPASRPARLGAWFHDAVYAGSPGRDEEDSAQLAADLLGPRLPAAEVGEVTRLVLLTAGHEVAAGDRDGVALCDADLAVLGSPPPRYDAYARDVRAEYSEVPAEVFRPARAGVLERFLDRERLYVSAAAHQRWESAARVNLTREVGRLRDE